jgi:hypothetical protein
MSGGSAQARVAGPLTRDRHFRFGHDHETGGSRQSAAQVYWTAYGASIRAEEGPTREFERAMGEMAARFGRLSIACAGGPVAIAAIAVAERLGMPARIVTVALDGVAPPVPPTRLEVTRIDAPFATFAAFAAVFAERAGSGCGWTALAAFLAARDDWPHLADHGEITLVDHGVDRVRATAPAPATLALADAEAFTGLDRWMALEGRPGIAQPLRWSPELVAAQLACPPMRRWIAVALGGGAARALSPDSHPARLAMWRQILPGLGAAVPARPWPDPELRARMRLLTRALRRRAPGCGAVHHHPLHRLAPRLGIDLGPGPGEGRDLYGAVGTAPPDFGDAA